MEAAPIYADRRTDMAKLIEAFRAYTDALQTDCTVHC